MTEWHARAPVRFCDLGGWTDTRIVPRGAVLNFATRMYTCVALAEGDGGGEIVLESLDTGEKTRFEDYRQVEYNGVLDLVKAAIARWAATHEGCCFDAEAGLTVLVRSDAPSASGLGSSAALGVAALAAMESKHGQPLQPLRIAREAQLLEVEDLNLECGVQDQLASACGGVNFMDVEYPEARVDPVPILPSLQCELEDRFVLVYTGQSRFSSRIHQAVIRESSGRNALFDRLARCAAAGRDALIDGDLDRFALAMNENWDAQKQLHPQITTSEIEALHEAVFRAGALGFKANGAGAGGTVSILAKQNQSARVRRVAAGMGMITYPALIDMSGVQVWTV